MCVVPVFVLKYIWFAFIYILHFEVIKKTTKDGHHHIQMPDPCWHLGISEVHFIDASEILIFLSERKTGISRLEKSFLFYCLTSLAMSWQLNMSFNIWKWKVICVYFVLFRCFRKRLTKAEDGEVNLGFEAKYLKNKREKR